MSGFNFRLAAQKSVIIGREFSILGAAGRRGLLVAFGSSKRAALDTWGVTYSELDWPVLSRLLLSWRSGLVGALVCFSLCSSKREVREEAPANRKRICHCKRKGSCASKNRGRRTRSGSMTKWHTEQRDDNV